MSDETYSSHGPECPYCGHEIYPEDPIFYNENDYTEDDCPKCGETFAVEVYHSTSWTCTKQDTPSND